MAENTAEKDALKASKDAEKAAKKAKQDRIKQSKPQKDGSFFARAGKSVKKFWKDFIGTIKKIVWPSGNQVLKNSLVVLVTILVIGLVVFGIDRGLTFVIQKGSDLAIKAGEDRAAAESTVVDMPTDPTTVSDITEVTSETETSEAGETTEAGETAEAEENTAETAETTTEAAETTTEAAAN